MRSTYHLTHGPRRRWWSPWERICICGMDAWPCPVQRMLARQEQMFRHTATGRHRAAMGHRAAMRPGRS